MASAILIEVIGIGKWDSLLLIVCSFGLVSDYIGTMQAYLYRTLR